MATLPPAATVASPASASTAASKPAAFKYPAASASEGRKGASASSTVDEDDFFYGVHVASSHLAVRMAFLRKVYGLVALQLLITAAVATFCILVPSVKFFVQNSPGAMVFAQISSFLLLMALLVFRQHSPINHVLLGGFTLCMSYMVATAVTFYAIDSVLHAVLLTSSIVTGLTFFAFQTKRDFTFANTALVSVLWLMIGLGLLLAFVPAITTLSLSYSIAAAVLFSLFIIVDTQMMMRKRSPDEYMLCVIDLYLDILNLFLHILKAVGKRN